MVPRYAYHALAADGSTLRGTLEADSDAQAMRQLHGQGAFPIDVRPHAPSWLDALVRRDYHLGPVATRRDVALLTQELASLLGAELPLDRVLSLMLEARARTPLAPILREVLAQVRRGVPLAIALEPHGKLFDRAYRSVVEAGERAGSLPQALKRLGDDRKRAEVVRQKITSSLTYPALLIVMAGLSVGFITTSVLPQFKPMLIEAGVAMTPSTQALFWLGELLSERWWLPLLLAIGIVAGSVLVLRHPTSRHWIDGQLLRVPGLSAFLRDHAAAQYCRLLGMLNGSDVALPTALGIASGTIANSTVRAALVVAQGRVKDGAGLSRALEQGGFCPPVALHLVRVGEETGRLPEMLLRAADLLDEQLQRSTERFVAMLVPGLTLAIGVVIAVVVTSVFAALLSLNEAIQ